MQTDKRLARRASEGDERAFAAIFRRYHQDLYRYCLAILRDPDEAQDALQNTMLSALKALPGESREIELKPWLYRIAHNESIDLVRRRRERTTLDPELAVAGQDLAREAELRERLGRLLADIEELPERQRGALLMRELGGLGFEQIGAALGCTPAVARQTTYEARLGLREFEAGREMDCVAATKALSDADGRVARRRDLRAHLRDCPSCTAFQAEIKGRRRDLAALSPLPALLGVGLLKGILGGGAAGAAGGGGLAGSVALKATATVAVVAALGVGAERGGLIDPVLPGGGSRISQAVAEEGASAAARAAAAPAAASAGGDLAAGGPGGSARAVTARGHGASVAKPEAATKAPADAPAATPAAATHGSEAANGKGHGAAHPAASQKGQQNAAAHKKTNQGRGGEHPARTEHPVHPTHPAKPPHPPKPPKPEKPATAQGPNPGPKNNSEAIPEAEKPASVTGQGKQPAPASDD